MPQCHDHPHDRYTAPEQFWEFAAFFAEMNPLPANRPNFVGPTRPQSEEEPHHYPEGREEVVARFFDGTETPTGPRSTTRGKNSPKWLTSPSNPFFAKNMANRMWAHFFGFGIQDPVDEPGEHNRAEQPGTARAIWARRSADAEVRQPRP